jgi:hypothetical protein
MLDVYNKLGKKNINSYATMSVLGLGSRILSEKLGQSLFRGLHRETLYHPEENTKYYVSLTTRYFYDHTVKGIYKSSPKKQDILHEEAQQILGSAPLFSEMYVQSAWALDAANVSYKTLSANKGNFIYDLIYGLTQPLCVALKDNGTLK